MESVLFDDSSPSFSVNLTNRSITALVVALPQSHYVRNGI